MNNASACLINRNGDIITSGSLNCSGNITTPEGIHAGFISVNNTISSYRPLTLSYQSTDVLTVSNDGLINCQSSQTQHNDGL